jgi:hypothetical protein
MGFLRRQVLIHHTPVRLFSIFLLSSSSSYSIGFLGPGWFLWQNRSNSAEDFQNSDPGRNRRRFRVLLTSKTSVSPFFYFIKKLILVPANN